MTQSAPAMTTQRHDAYDDELWTSAEVAHAFRVGVSSVKRWTDDGELESVRTPGRHRRYTVDALHRFASIRGLPADRLPPLAEGVLRAVVPPPADVTLYDALAAGDRGAIRHLTSPRVRAISQRAAFLDRVVGEALREIGYRWERGELGVEQEHRASYLLIEEVDRLRPPVRDDAPRAILMCPPGELHDLPLRLVRLVLEWVGWRTVLLGASLPWQSAVEAVRRDRPSVVALSARAATPFHARDFDDFVDDCRRLGARVIVGGEWARGGTDESTRFLRFRTLRGFERWLRGQTRPD
ncbi:MAG TPA: cobalamin-dependent protein [Thermoanaerobaculia bacterium]|nr:cobalamin-dependent protein [Thermoanaerobaculia bacterium]